MVTGDKQVNKLLHETNRWVGKLGAGRRRRNLRGGRKFVWQPILSIWQPQMKILHIVYIKTDLIGRFGFAAWEGMNRQSWKWFRHILYALLNCTCILWVSQGLWHKTHIFKYKRKIYDIRGIDFQKKCHTYYAHTVCGWIFYIMTVSTNHHYTNII